MGAQRCPHRKATSRPAPAHGRCRLVPARGGQTVYGATLSEKSSAEREEEREREEKVKEFVSSYSFTLPLYFQHIFLRCLCCPCSLLSSIPISAWHVAQLSRVP